ncbi:MAG: T9SS type A sorting domain-containing protein [Aureispira sp.]|nr:T9SS type A sorting domain-containing protein [Aureispira sp.]
MQKLKIYCTFILFNLLIVPSITAQQYLQSYQFQGHYTISQVETILTNFGVPTGLIVPEFEVDVYKIIYNTRNAQDTGNTIASGAIAVPSGITCPLPIAVYAHGTTSKRYDVPSYGSSELNIGIIMASMHGYVVDMPDYLGLGDSPGFHPYVHAKSEASASRDMIRASRELADSVNYNLNGQIVLAGYSQGGHAAMATFRELELNHPTEFTVTAAAPMSGPYDVSGVQAVSLTADAPYSTPGYLPYIILGYQEAYGNLYNSLSEVLKSPYDTLIPQYFDGTNSIGYINNQVPDTPKHMLDSAFLVDLLNNPNNPGRLALQDNDLYDWIPTAPLHMLGCNGDEQVTFLNAVVTYDTMTTLGASNVAKTDFGNFSHSGCVQFSLISGINFFNQYRDLLGGMQVSSTVIDASSGNNDGSINIAASNGTGAYSYDWQNGLSGQTTSTVSGLAPGTYQVRVSDNRGCYTYEDVTVSMATGVKEITPQDIFKLYPNPAQDVVFLKLEQAFEQNYTISLRDLMGKTIHQVSDYNNSIVRYDVSELPKGVYVVEVTAKNKRYVQKLVVN